MLRNSPVLFCFIFILFFLTFCKEKRHSETPVVTYNDLVFDSLRIDTFLVKHPIYGNGEEKVKAFYRERSYKYAWFNKTGILEQAGNLVNLLNNAYQDGLIEKYFKNEHLFKLYTKVVSDTTTFRGANDTILELDFLLTSEFFKYATRAWGGVVSTQAEQLEWYIPQKRLEYEFLLDSLLAGDKELLTEKRPLYKQYSLLQKFLKKYRDLETESDWEEIVPEKALYKIGDTSEVVLAIKKRLSVLGDLTENDYTEAFDKKTEVAVKSFQNRYGMIDDGIIGKNAIKELNLPIKKRIEQILINMERVRWLPVNQKGDYLVVNIPEYRLHVFENEKLLWDCNVIVGTAANNTVIFSGDLKYIVFSPYWTIPNGILGNEILPSVRRDPNYLATHNMEVANPRTLKPLNPYTIPWANYKASNFPYLIRQKPGSTNSLGWVAFLFPNRYDIYLHDTPARYLFNEPARSFSHGCIRVGEPLLLTKHLLRHDSTWTEKRIKNEMYRGVETIKVMNKTVPVFIVYFTAWVDKTGKLNFRDDIYGHDAKMSKVLFAEPEV